MMVEDPSAWALDSGTMLPTRQKQTYPELPDPHPVGHQQDGDCVYLISAADAMPLGI